MVPAARFVSWIGDPETSTSEPEGHERRLGSLDVRHGCANILDRD
jgi:hypothetical protein